MKIDNADLRAFLYQTMLDVKSGTVTPEQATAIGSLAEKMLRSARVDIAASKARMNGHGISDTFPFKLCSLEKADEHGGIDRISKQIVDFLNEHGFSLIELVATSLGIHEQIIREAAEASNEIVILANGTMIGIV